MKRYFGIFLAFVLTVSLANISARAEAKLETVEIKTSAVCEDCKERIEKTVNKLDGVQKSNLDLDTKIVTVSYNPDKVNVEKIKTSISKAGYSADEVKADKKGYNKLPSCCKVKPESK